eukprot:3870726-Rhodomonas_salina.1
MFSHPPSSSSASCLNHVCSVSSVVCEVNAAGSGEAEVELDVSRQAGAVSYDIEGVARDRQS